MSGCCWPPGPLPGGCRGSTAGTTSGALPTYSRCGSGCDPAPGSGVIGGGFIGLELAASATARGCAVTVVEIAPRLLARAVPAEVAATVAARHEQAGVAALTNPAMPLKALLRAHNVR
jgi:NAD(P)H-nitrite reductase large subunit